MKSLRNLIRRKVRFGIFFIAALLFFSGMISSGELVRLNKTTSELLSASKGNIELCKTLLDCVQQENTLFLHSIQDSSRVSPRIAEIHIIFDTTMTKIKSAFKDQSSTLLGVERIEKAADRYNQDVSDMTGKITLEWFANMYSTSYEGLTTSIKEFMILNENNILASAGEIQGNANRASLLGILSLGAGILLLVLFYFLLNGFFLSPILKVQKGLTAYLEREVPYKVEIETQDEIRLLSEGIKDLINNRKRRSRIEY
ncbi:MAG: hypothetical protein R3Y49_02690 [Rikenellaceae bacterium]